MRKLFFLPIFVLVLATAAGCGRNPDHQDPNRAYGGSQEGAGGAGPGYDGSGNGAGKHGLAAQDGSGTGADLTTTNSPGARSQIAEMPPKEPAPAKSNGTEQPAKQ